MLDNMCAEAGAPVNFTIFLNMLADKLHGTDPEDVIVRAFKLFDKDNKGVVPASNLADVLTARPIDSTRTSGSSSSSSPNQTLTVWSTTRLCATPSLTVAETRTKRSKHKQSCKAAHFFVNKFQTQEKKTWKRKISVCCLSFSHFSWVLPTSQK